MDFEYFDDADAASIAKFVVLSKKFAFADDDIRDVFRLLTSGDDEVVPHDMFAYTFRESDLADTRITRICKSFSNQIFRIQFLNGDQFIIRLNDNHSYEEEIAIINAAAGAGVEVPRNYFSYSYGVSIGQHKYYAMLQEYVRGTDFLTAVKKGLVSVGDKAALLEDMGHQLRLIHSVTAIDGKEQENTHTNYFDEALSTLDHERSTIIEEGICSNDEFETLFVKLDSMRDSARVLSDGSFGLTHFDYHPKHVLLDLETGRPVLRAIIDWGNAAFSNTYFDFALWDYWCGEDFIVDSLLEAYGMEKFSSAESKINVEFTTIAALMKEVAELAHLSHLRASQLGAWQRLSHEVELATY